MIVLHDFLEANRSELIARCAEKAARRTAPAHVSRPRYSGIPVFLGQLITTLRNTHAGISSSDAPGQQADVKNRSETTNSAARKGGELLREGFPVDEVVHSYGDLCQAVTDLAVESKKGISPEDFRTLNGCLDDAIADAVTEFGWQRDKVRLESVNRDMGERLGFLAHEMRNFLNTAMLSFAAMKGGSVALNGATSAVLDRSLSGLRDLIDRALADVRLTAGVPTEMDYIALGHFVAEVQMAASLEARRRGCEFIVLPVEPGLAIHADKPMLYSALSNVLQNAFKFTRAQTSVTLKAYGAGDRILIEVHDQCGGLPAGKADAIFHSFEQHGEDRSGLGLGLSISNRAVQACGGKLSVRDIPGTGCVFTIEIPRGDGVAQR